MSKTKPVIVFLILACAHLAALGQGVILWDESVNGELSQDFAHPTSLTPVLAGTNSVIGATGVARFVTLLYMEGRLLVPWSLRPMVFPA